MMNTGRKETGRWITILITLNDKEIESLTSTHIETKMMAFLAGSMSTNLQDLKMETHLQANPKNS